MRIGYACTNTRLEPCGPHPSQLNAGPPERLRTTLEESLECLSQVLAFNRRSGLLMFRLSSDLVPHDPAFGWRSHYAARFREIGDFVRRSGIRLSIHPDQFTIVNAPEEDIFARSLSELEHNAAILDALGLDHTHRIQIHVGGIYGTKADSIRFFVDRYGLLPEAVRTRLAIENDGRLFDLSDCLAVHRETGIPVAFDTLHHALNNDGTTLREGIGRAMTTWTPDHGPLMVAYSTQHPGKRAGCHACSIDVADFRSFLDKTAGMDFDVVCEIKDKETSALKALAAARQFGRV